MNLPVPNAYPQVGGRLAQFYCSWSNFTSDSWVLQAVSGYKLEFVCEPFQVNKPRGIVFSDVEKKLINLEVQKMLQKGAIRRASFSPRQFVSNLFIIPKKSGDLRPVINLKPLNEFVQYHHFKMEGLNTLLDLLSGSEFFTTIDLKDAYFTIPIHRDHYKYLRFEWNSTLFEFICLPFGLSSAPRVFTKVLKPFVGSIRNKGIRLVIYLDDMAIISSSRELSSQEAAIVVRTLESLGFIINKEKSVLIPSQRIVFLGYVIDSVAMTVSLPEEKLNKLKEQTLSLWEKPQCSIRELAHVIGLIVSSFPAIKPARLYYRDLEVCKLEALSSSDGDYNAIIYLSQLARDSLQWFVFNSHLYNGTRITKPSKVMTMTTDASHSGWGVVCDGVSSSGLWSSEEQAMHINWLELSAVLFGVKCFVHSHNCLVKVFCDNSTAVAYINNLGGMVPSLHAVSKSIWEWCFAHNCMLEAFHIPGSSNLQADSLSRQYNKNLEWKLHPTVFKWISQSLFVPNIDLFASRLNFQTNVYVSWFPDPGAWAVDAFSFCWREFKPYIFPPFSLLGRILMKLKVEEVSDALIIAPWWPTAHWYPQLLQLLVQRPILLPQWDKLLTLPQEDFLHPLKDVMRLAAWHVSGITYRSEEFLQGQPAMCSSHGVQGQKSSIQRLGNVFVAGVIGNREILFKQI